MSFKAVAAKMAKQPGFAKKGKGALKAASAALAVSSRNASPAAKRKNPKLLRVK